MLRVCSGGTRAGGAQLRLLTFGRKQEVWFRSALRSINTEFQVSGKNKDEKGKLELTWWLCTNYMFYFWSFLVIGQLVSHKTAVIQVKVSNMLGLNHSGFFGADLVESCSNSGGDTVRRFHPDWHLNDWMVQKSRVETNWTCFGSLNLNRT